MPKLEEEPLTSIQVRLFTSDLAALRKLYSQSPGVNKAIRTILRTFLRQAEANAAVKIDAAPMARLEIPLPSLMQDLTP